MGDRSFLVHVPPTYNYQTQYPVVLSFHGYGDNDTWQVRLLLELSRVAPNLDTYGLI